MFYSESPSVEFMREDGENAVGGMLNIIHDLKHDIELSKV